MTQDWAQRPYVGVGCIAHRGGKWLMVKSHSGFWSTPGGHLDFGETPDVCARRETLEETGIVVPHVDFLGITSEVRNDVERHYVTIWMTGVAEPGEARVGDADEIAEVGWFAPNALPEPRFIFLENLLAGRLLRTTGSIPI